MSYVRIDSSVRTNKKFLQAGPAPSWLWLCGLLYCQEGKTNGFIPVEALDYLGVKNARRRAAHLVKANLWHEVSGGWQVHDYLEHNRSAEVIQALSGMRRDAGVLGGKASGEARREASAKQVGSTDTKQTANPVQISTVQSSTDTEGGARARSAPLVDRHHRTHAECGRVCLPAVLFSEFVRRRNHDGADREIRDWFQVINAEWQESSAEPGDAFDFWKARYAEKWPAAKPVNGMQWRPESREAFVDSARRVPFYSHQCEHDEPKCTNAVQCASRGVGVAG